MAQFRLRNGRLRGGISSRLRGSAPVASGTVVGLTPGTATLQRFGRVVGSPRIPEAVTVIAGVPKPRIVAKRK